MNILSIEYTLNTKGLDIYVAGCKPPHCKNCHNPESWDFNQGWNYDETIFQHIKERCSKFNRLIDNIFIFGGEPLDQNLKELENFLYDLSTLKLDIWLFTRHDITKIPQEILQYCTYIKTGRYLPEKKVNGYVMYGIELATSNQKIYNRKDILCQLENLVKK